MPQPKASYSATAELDQVLRSILDAPPCEVPYASFPRENIVLYGGGRLGRMAALLLAKAGIKIACIVDKNAEGVQKDFSVPVRTVEQAVATLDRDIFIFDCVFKDKIHVAKNIFSPHGFNHIYTAYDLFYALPSLHFFNGWQSGPLRDSDKQGITSVCKKLADNASCAAYLTNVAWRVSRHFPDIPGFFLLEEEKKYWNDLTRQPLVEKKHCIDAGAFDLFFTLQTLNALHNPYEIAGISAFEPDPESMLRCEKIMAGLPHAAQQKIHLSPLAVSEKEGRTAFIGGSDLSSKLANDRALTGKETIIACDTTTLDVLGRELPAIGYIKLHVEGEELPCIRGGLHCIEKHRPILAVNCSHNRDGLWKLPHFIMEHTPRYRYYFRVHAHYGEGLYFYAIPDA